MPEQRHVGRPGGQRFFRHRRFWHNPLAKRTETEADWLLAYGRITLRNIERYPYMAVNRPYATPASLRHLERVLGALVELGLEPAEAMSIHSAVADFVVGVGQRHLEADRENRQSGRTPGEALHAAVQASNDALPILGRAIAKRAVAESSVRFEEPEIFSKKLPFRFS